MKRHLLEWSVVSFLEDSSVAEAFDPYLKWLGIAPEDQPPDLYRLLGVPTFVDDADVIESGAERQMAHVRRFQSGAHSEVTQQILNEISRARVTLLNPEKKAAYDKQLQASSPHSESVTEDNNDLAVRPTEDQRKPSSSTQLPLILGGTCAAVVIGLIIFVLTRSSADQTTQPTENKVTSKDRITTPQRLDATAAKQTALDQNLLETVQLKDDARGQTWRRDGKSLVHQGESDDDGFVTIPVPIETDRYEVELAFTRHAGKYRVSLILPVGQRYCTAAVSVTKDGRTIFGGLALLNGKRIWRHRARRKHADLRDKKVHRLTCQVQTSDNVATISMALDGNPMTSWTGPISALSVEEFEQPSTPRRLAIYSSPGHTQFHSLKLK